MTAQLPFTQIGDAVPTKKKKRAVIDRDYNLPRRILSCCVKPVAWPQEQTWQACSPSSTGVFAGLCAMENQKAGMMST